MTSNILTSRGSIQFQPSLQARSVVPGRIRWEVPDLQQRPKRAAMVAQRLAHTPGVREATANPVTARVLVVFDPAKLATAALEQVVSAALLAPVRSNGLVERTERHQAHGEGGLGGFILRLIAGGLALGGMLVHKVFWLPLGIPPGLTLALGVGMTIIAGYPFFRGGSAR